MLRNISSDTEPVLLSHFLNISHVIHVSIPHATPTMFFVENKVFMGPEF